MSEVPVQLEQRGGEVVAVLARVSFFAGVPGS